MPTAQEAHVPAAGVMSYWPAEHAPGEKQSADAAAPGYDDVPNGHAVHCAAPELAP